MTSQSSLDIAARMGARAGQSFLDTGIWPRCPFRDARVAELAQAWSRAVFDVVGPARAAAAAEAATEPQLPDA